MMVQPAPIVPNTSGTSHSWHIVIHAPASIFTPAGTACRLRPALVADVQPAYMSPGATCASLCTQSTFFCSGSFINSAFVTELLNPDMLIEIEATAWID